MAQLVWSVLVWSAEDGLDSKVNHFRNEITISTRLLSPPLSVLLHAGAASASWLAGWLIVSEVGDGMTVMMPQLELQHTNSVSPCNWRRSGIVRKIPVI